MTKYDPHNHKRYYKRWRDNGAPLLGISEDFRVHILQICDDFEIGANVSPASKKGSRSYGRLRNFKTKLNTLCLMIQDELKIYSMKDLENKDNEMLRLFHKIRDGGVTCRTMSKTLHSAGLYAKHFKAYWHWYQRIERKKGRDVRDIMLDVDGRDPKHKFNYFTIEDVQKLCNEAPYDYRVMMMFMFDSGIRSPTELMNITPNDLEWDSKGNYYMLTIREEVSKTFGRRIKLLLSSEILKGYLQSKKFSPDDLIFKKLPTAVNLFLKRLGHKVLKIGESVPSKLPNGHIRNLIHKGLTMYDFRHASACYWLMRYKSESALKYRFGWKKSDMIFYYTELMGMNDTIQDDDLYLDISKTELEKQINGKGTEINILQEQLQVQDKCMKEQDQCIKEQEKRMAEMYEILKAIQLEKVFDSKKAL